MSPQFPADLLDASPPERPPVSLRDSQSRDILRRAASALLARNGRSPKHSYPPQKKSLKTRSKRIPEQDGFLGDFLCAGTHPIHGTT